MGVVVAYFYPQDTLDPERVARANNLGLKAILSDAVLVNNAVPLCANHSLKKYAVAPGLTDWQDTNPVVMSRHVQLARAAGINGFIFDTYSGEIEGRGVNELNGAVETFRNLKLSDFYYAHTLVLGRPRVQFPIPLKDNWDEPGRYYDLTASSAKYSIKQLASHWSDKNYLRVQNRPYLGIIFPLTMHNHGDLTNNQHLVQAYINSLRLSSAEFHENPYIVGVIPGNKTMQGAIKYFTAAGVDMLTTYVFLPDFGKEFPFWQDYNDLSIARARYWEVIKRAAGDVPFAPAAIPGWDASPRGVQGLTVEKVIGIYPFHPIVTNCSSQGWLRHLLRVLSYIRHNLPVDQRIVHICAWNEIGEQCSILPTINSKGQLDYSYIEMTTKALKHYEY